MEIVSLGSNKNEASRTIHEKTNRSVGMLVEFLSVGGDVLLAAFMLPQIIISYFVYFTMDSDSGAFILLLQTW